MSEQETKQERPGAYWNLPPKKRMFVDQYFICGMCAAKAARRMKYKAAGRVGWRFMQDPQVRQAVQDRMTNSALGADEVLYLLREQATATADDFLSFETVVERFPVLRPVSELLAELEEKIEFEREYARRAELDGAELDGHDVEIASMERRALRYRMRLERNPDATETVLGPPVEKAEPVPDLRKAKQRGKLHLVKALKRDRFGRLGVELHDAQAANVHLGKHLGLFVDKHEHSGPNGGAIPISHVTDADRLERLEALKRAAGDREA